VPYESFAKRGADESIGCVERILRTVGGASSVSVELLRRRLLERLSVVESVEEYSESLRLRLGGASVVLRRSFARGDFNAWSDVDLVVVSEKFRGAEILDRYSPLDPPPRVEAVPPGPGGVRGEPKEACVEVCAQQGLRHSRGRLRRVGGNDWAGHRVHHS